TEARAARRCDMRLSASRRPGAAPRPSQLVSQDIFQRLEVEGLVGDDPLQLAVLVLELLEPLRVRNLHAAVLPLPGIQGLSAHAEPAAQLAHVRACLRLLDRSDLLLLREPALAHNSSAFGAPESDYKWIRFRGSAQGAYNGKAIPRQRWGQPVNPPSVRVRNLPGRYNPASLRRAPYPYVGSRCSPPDTDRSLGTGCASNCCHNHRIVVLRACGWAYSVR